MLCHHPDEAMKLFRVTETHPLGRGIDAGHPFGLPGVTCDSCGTTWATTGVEYPTVNAAPLANRLGDATPVPLAQFKALTTEVRTALGTDLYLRPGTTFGALRGKFTRKLSDIEWLVPWTLLASDAALEQLRSAGISLRAAPTELRGKTGTAPVITLHEVEIPPLARLHDEMGRPADCEVCGYKKVPWPERIVIRGTTVPADAPLVRVRDFPTLIIASEAFVAAARALRLPNLAFEDVDVT